ncbi:MAG: phosphoenolpyruvate synthase [Planctomycetes bacterium]|nr:phosphoenolpyruvate synthase [Planctomycetota bacterium]
MRFVIRDHEADLQSPLGGKARALASLRQVGLPIPAWLVVTPDAFHKSLSPEQQDTLHAARDAETIRAVVEQVRPVAEVLSELLPALDELCADGTMVAVRSSASEEDGAQHSFAGQLDSFLFVRKEDVAEMIAAVWRSGFSERIVAYRREHGLPLTPRPPAVLVQRMVNADVAGVAFGADPVSGRRRVAVVSAVWGLGTALVSGDADADTFLVDDDGTIIGRTIAHKRTAHRPAPGSGEGVVSVAVPDEQARAPALDDRQVCEIAELVRGTGKHFGRPQDIEWAIEGGRLFLLQSRPITSLAQVADPDGVVNLWDNSNIAESYNGITTPLTFSFARRAYEEVYRQFCRILRVPEAKIEASADVFRHMLGLTRGRVYYNLLNWYRLLTLLPGFKANRRFMEQMMGVKEGLPEHFVAAMTQSTRAERFKDRFEKLRPDELVAYYRDIEAKLLTHWDAPLVNDFFAMIFYGVLGRLTRKWCGDSEGTLQNDLLCGEGGMISAEPAARVKAMAETARRHPALMTALGDGTLADIHDAVGKAPEFAVQYRAYLDKFGDRCLEELKLESPTLFDDPLTLFRSVGQMARRLAEGHTPPAVNHEAEVRRKAEERVRSALWLRPFRRMIFGWVLKNARARVRDRENLRFERTRLFGRVRMILLELGRKFHAVDMLEHPRDVFYLEVEEALGFVTGTVTTTDLKGLVALRKAEFDRYRAMPAPADRFETRGAVHQGNAFTGKGATVEDVGGEQRKGLGCCPGVVRGPVRVITDPRNATLKSGDILVAERTDPGWIMLFPSAAGLLVERGSLLSHSAIVAREMGIPAVVSLAGVTRWLKDGDEVELDGSTGIVTGC